MPRRLLAVFALGLALPGCHRTAPLAEAAPLGDPAPPEAPVIATLSESGPRRPDPRAGADAVPPGAIVDTAPVDYAGPYEPVTVTFATDMDTRGDPPQFSFTPPLAGHAVWTSPTRATFSAEQRMPEATAFVVHVEGDARTRDGASVAVDQTWTFETPRPTASLQSDGEATGFDEKEVGADWNEGFDVDVSHDVGADALRRALSVRDEASGRSLPFRVRPRWADDRGKPATAWHVFPPRHWPANTTIRADLDGTLVTTAGPLPTGRAVFATMKTRPGVAARLTCDDQASDGCAPAGLTLEFDGQLPARMAKKVRVSPRPENLRVRPWLWNAKTTFDEVDISGDFEPGTTYTVTLGRGMVDEYGQSVVGSRRFAKTFVAPPPLLNLRAATGTLVATGRGTMGIESRGIEAATLSVTQLDDAALAAFVTTPADEWQRPAAGGSTASIELDLKPGGTWGWDARELPLAKLFSAQAGAAYVELSVDDVLASQRGRAVLPPRDGFVQLTNLGVVAGRSPAGGFIQVLSLDDAKPVAGAMATAYSVKGPHPTKIATLGPSSAEGLLTIPREVSKRADAVVVRTDEDRVAVALEEPRRYRYHHQSVGEAYDVGVLMADRGLVQPGERLRVMGWLARSSTTHTAGIESAPTRSITVKIEDYKGTELSSHTVRSKPSGKFWATLPIPKSAKLGSGSITANIGSTSLKTSVGIREFVAPAFDVAMSLDASDLSFGQSTTARASARYLHGMAMPVVQANASTRCRAAAYQPPGYVEFDALEPASATSHASTPVETLSHVDDHDDGLIIFDPEFPALSAGQAYRCTVSLAVMDAARQELGTEVAAWVHPTRYVMVRSPTRWPTAGKPQTWSIQALSPDGTRLDAAPVSVRIASVDAETAEETFIHRCSVRPSARELAKCTWAPPKAGRYAVRVRSVVDGVEVEERSTLWVDDDDDDDPAPRRDRFRVKVPDRAEPGDTIDIDVHAVRPTGRGLAVGVHAGIRSLNPFDVVKRRGTGRLALDDAWVPRAHVDTLVVHPNSSHSLPEIERAEHHVRLGYDSRALQVEVTNAATSGTRQLLPIDVTVTDPEGTPVPDARVSLWAVDEGILLLRDWTFPNIAESLAPDRGNEADYVHGYDQLRNPYVKRDDPYEPNALGTLGLRRGGASLMGRGAGGGAGGRGRSTQGAQVRRDFDPVPIFIGDVKTRSDGTARIEGMLPDNLTTFRIAAIATAEVAGTGAYARAGHGESRVRVTAALAVRPVLPRVLRPGDVAELAVLVDNLSGASGHLDLEVDLLDADGVARRVDTDSLSQPLDQAQLRVPVRIEALGAGVIRVQVRARITTTTGRTLTDASELPLEVRPERTLVRHAALYGSLEEAGANAVELALPDDHRKGSARASIDLHASMLGGYAGAVDTIVHYPYGCLEQTSSRLVPLAALHGLDGFDLGVTDIDAFSRAGLDRLARMQTDEGGFAYWPKGKSAHLYGTAYAVWVLSELDRAGVTGAGALMKEPTAYLERTLAARRAKATPTGHEDAVGAMAALAMAAAGRDAGPILDDLASRPETLPAFARALLALGLHTAHPGDRRIRDLLDSVRARVELRGDVARAKAESKRYAALFDSPVRTDAMILLALSRIAPDDPLVEPLARGLAAARDAGTLRNTQESAYALLAMSAYAAARESVIPELDAHAWIGDDMVLDVGFHGRDLAVHHADAAASERVTMAHTGEGRLYYRVGMNWSPTEVEASASGLAIERKLLSMHGPIDDAKPMVAGEAGLLEVTVTADARTRYVVLDLPLPAGLVGVDRSLGRGGVVRSVGGSGSATPWLAYDHIEIRSDRVLIFADRLPAGTWRVQVPVRATHEGRYAFPPAHVGAMYEPEVAGNTDDDVVTVVSP
ncbi:MAG: alpha-2-macroglobulin family protein [Myxococcota bacterium]